MLSKQDIETLNAARTVLAALEMEARSYHSEHEDWERDNENNNYGRLAEAASVADGLIFNVLNTASSYCGMELTDEELHNRKQVPA